MKEGEEKCGKRLRKESMNGAKEKESVRGKVLLFDFKNVMYWAIVHLNYLKIALEAPYIP
jgi:hypothetical protein